MLYCFVYLGLVAKKCHSAEDVLTVRLLQSKYVSKRNTLHSAHIRKINWNNYADKMFFGFKQNLISSFKLLAILFI